VTIYGGEFEQAASLLIGLALFRVLGTQSFPLIKVLHGLDMPDLNLKLSTVALGVNIVLGVVLTIRFGAIGVVVATVAAEATRYGGIVYVLKRELPEVGLFPRELGRQVAASAVMFVVVSALHAYFPVRSWVDLSALLAAGATTYAVVLLSISARLRLTIASVLHGSRVEHVTPDAILRWR
jgi:O-antigen/teichoic acid export membrane protein